MRETQLRHNIEEEIAKLPFGETRVALEIRTGSVSQLFGVYVSKKGWLVTTYMIRIFIENEYPMITPGSVLKIKETSRFTKSAVEKEVEFIDKCFNEWKLVYYEAQMKYDFNTMENLVANKRHLLPLDWVDNPDKYIKRGDVLISPFWEVLHHAGIYMGNNTVIHMSGHGGGKLEGMVRRGDLLEHFAGEDKDRIHVVQFYMKKRTADEICKAAEKYLIEQIGPYNLVNNNCQHFVNLCVYGHKMFLSRRDIQTKIMKSVEQQRKFTNGSEIASEAHVVVVPANH